MLGEIGFITDENGEKIFFSMVQKQSESRFSFNERILVLVNQKCIGYISKCDKKDLASCVDSKKMKKKYALKDLRSTIPKGKQLTLCFNDYQDAKQNKPKSVKWLFRMQEPKLVQRWVELIEQQNSPYTTRKTTVDKNQQMPISQNPKQNPTIKQISEQLSRRGYDSPQKTSEKPFSPPKEIQAKINNERLSQEKNYKKRESEISFMKRQENKIDEFPEQPNFMNDEEPIEKEEKQKKVREEEKLSKILQKKVNFAKVEQEYDQYKQEQMKKKREKSRLTGLGSSIHVSSKKQHFSNYFRPYPLKLQTVNHQKSNLRVINDLQFESFIDSCKGEVQDIVNSKLRGEEEDEEMWDEENVYLRNGLIINLVFSQIKQIPGNNNVCDEGAIKKYLSKQKNMDYLWKVIANDEELVNFFMIPMSCIVEYFGYFAYVSCQFDDKIVSSLAGEESPDDFSMYFEKLSKNSNISRNALESQQFVKFMKVGNKFVIYEVSQYLPRYTNNATVIRPQLFEKIFNNSDLVYHTKKGKREEEQQAKILKQPLKQNIEQLAKAFEKLEQYIVHPREFSRFLHKYGININLMHELHSKINNTFIKNLIKTEAIVRSFKMLFRKKMQSCTEEPLKTAQKMLNILLSRSNQSEMMWKIIILHSQCYFKISAQKQEINKGYLIMCLEYHLGLILKTKFQTCQEIFTCDSFVKNIEECYCKVKCCKFYWLSDQLQNIPQDEQSSVLIQKLKLKSKKIPFYITQNSENYEKILQILSIYNRPNTFPHIKFFQQASSSIQFTLSYFRRRITQIKWYIKANQISEQNLSSELLKIKEQLYFYTDNYHPLFSEIFDLLIEYYLGICKYEKALQECKNNLANVIQVCGGNVMHIKLAGNYYQMGDCLYEWKKYEEAIAHYKKSKNILEVNTYNKEKSYAVVLYRLGFLYLTKYKDQESIKLFQTAESIMEMDIEENYEQLVDLYELMYRCTSLDPERKLKIMEKIMQTQKTGIEKDLGDDEDMLKLIKLFVTLYFYLNSAEIRLDFLTYIEDCSDQLRNSNMDLEKALKVIKEFIINDKLLQTLENFHQKSVTSTKANQHFERKRNKEIELFESLISSLILVTSQGFMLGVLEEYKK